MKSTSQHKAHPDWALKYKTKGTELRFINNHYYLYQVTSKWNATKKRSQKITGKLLGRITPEGFIQSDKQKLREQSEHIVQQLLYVKEYGASQFIQQQFNPQLKLLQQLFPDRWSAIVVLAFVRLLYQAPLKNVAFRFEHSFLSELYPDLRLSDKQASQVLTQLGLARDKVVHYMQSFIQGGDYVLIDGTHIISHSRNIELAQHGYNSQQQYEPQVNLMFLFSSKLRLPVFYRLLPGNIREVKSFKLTLAESGLADVVIITDKGFYSQFNVNCLDEEQLSYIIPLRRNSSLIRYDPIEQPKKAGFENYFRFHNRFIWYYTLSPEPHKRVLVFYDEQLRLAEETDYLTRIETHPEEYNLTDFRNKQATFGTLAIYSNVAVKQASDIYQCYKSRGEIETMFDTLKNSLQADASYMQDEFTLQGWMFINYLALQWHYQIYKLLVEKKLSSKYSVKDLLMHLSEIKKVKINQTWRLSEITAKTQSLLNKLDIPIT